MTWSLSCDLWRCWVGSTSDILKVIHLVKTKHQTQKDAIHILNKNRMKRKWRGICPNGFLILPYWGKTIQTGIKCWRPGSIGAIKQRQWQYHLPLFLKHNWLCILFEYMISYFCVLLISFFYFSHPLFPFNSLHSPIVPKYLVALFLKLENPILIP